MVHDPVAEDGEAAPDPFGVGRLDVVPAGEVERDPVVGEAAQCVEQLQHPLADHPVADADGRGPAAVAQVGTGRRHGRHVAPGRDDPNAVGGQPVRRGDEVPRAATGSSSGTPGSISPRYASSSLPPLIPEKCVVTTSSGPGSGSATAATRT